LPRRYFFTPIRFVFCFFYISLFFFVCLLPLLRDFVTLITPPFTLPHAADAGYSEKMSRADFDAIFADTIISCHG